MAPLNIAQAIQLALTRHREGKLAEADQICRQVLTQEPANAQALHLLGAVSAQRGNLTEGIELIRRAIATAPGVAAYHYNLANLLSNQRSTDEAIAEYRRAIDLNPKFIEAIVNLGQTLADCGRLDEAIAALQEAYKLGPERIDVLNNLANAMRDGGDYQQAISIYTDGLRIHPASPELHNNCGIALQNLGQVHEAITHYRQAIQLRPQFAQARNNHALALLLTGNYAEGLVEFEWRWRSPRFRTARREFRQPMWDGSALGDRVILLHAEGGIGDTLQLVRYVPIVAQQGEKIILQCQRELIRLLTQMPGVEHLIPLDEPPPAFDVHCPLMSLPLVLGTRVESIPSRTPYLSFDPELHDSWGKKLGPRGDAIRVGLSWSGNPKFKEDLTRSIDLSQLLPLAAVPGVEFHSLQKGPSPAPISAAPPPLKVVDHADDLHDFAHTAALMSHMDLVVSTDNSRANLAGAMGLPTWVMLQSIPDWRWLLEREDSPWYPTARLFRQNQPGDWAEVIGRVAGELRTIHRHG